MYQDPRLLELEQELDDKEPYSSISNRDPLEDLSPEGRAQSVADRSPSGAISDFASKMYDRMIPNLNETADRPPVGGASSGQASPYQNALGVPDFSFKQKSAYAGLPDEILNAPNSSRAPDKYAAPVNPVRAAIAKKFQSQSAPPVANVNPVKVAIQKKLVPALPSGPAPVIPFPGPSVPPPSSPAPSLPPAAAAAVPASDDSDDADRVPAVNDDFIKAMAQSNGILGVGQGISRASYGASAPVSDAPFFSNQQHGNDRLASINGQNQQQRQAIFNAIQNRKLQQSTNAQNILLRQQALGAQIDNNKANQNLKQQGLGLQDKNIGIKATGQAQNNALKNQQVNIRAGNAANTLMNSSPIQMETNKLGAASNAQALIQGIRSGSVVGSKNIGNQLTNLINRIEMGGPGAVSDRQAAGVQTLYGKLQGAKSYLTGKPTDTIPNDYLDQLDAETQALGQRALTNYKNLTDSAIAGAVDPTVAGAASKRQQSLLKSNALAPAPDQGQTKVINGKTYKKVPGGWEAE